MEERYCIRCGEDFPVSPDGVVGWLMGWLRELKYAPKRIKDSFAMKATEDSYLCGNCYYDMTDE